MKAVWCDHRTAPVCVKVVRVKIQKVDIGKNIHRSLLRIRESSCITLKLYFIVCSPKFVVTVLEKRLQPF